MANVKLSARELDMVCNADIILTKNNIITKVYDLFGALSEYYIKEGKFLLPDEVQSVAPKISRGENYEGLPWVMLDYPRHFKGDDQFAVRTFFWWGNFISIALQLKGKYASQCNIANMITEMNDWYLCCNENEWQHHFREDNYKRLNSFSAGEINQLPFVKLAAKMALTNFNDAEYFLRQRFDELMQGIKKAASVN
jgi:hypothetical protein